MRAKNALSVIISHIFTLQKNGNDIRFPNKRKYIPNSTLEKRITAYPKTKNMFPIILKKLRVGYFGCINLSVFIFT